MTLQVSVASFYRAESGRKSDSIACSYELFGVGCGHATAGAYVGSMRVLSDSFDHRAFARS